ncbi:MAG: protein jag [Oscillospiraceae bacterium]|nr:protein jag [Oscillospiraceae bacterium]
MEKTIITTGKTVDLAIEAALAQLGLDRDSVSVQIITREKSGFLGIGNQPAKVEVTYEAPDPEPEKPRVALSSASRSKPKAKPVAAQPAPAPVAPKAEPKPVVKTEPKPVAPKAPAEPKVYAPAEAGSVEEKIEKFLKGLLEHMGSDAVPHAWKEEGNTYKVEFEGSDLGYLIGRRGDTLDALQHLANYSVGRTVEGHIRINVDAEDYRAKREDSLSRYARKKAQQVLKARRRTTLEPMNAYERHVIHAALQDMDNITTHSTGTEPNRRVVIEYVR